jgi:hypothetical protein
MVSMMNSYGFPLVILIGLSSAAAYAGDESPLPEPDKEMQAWFVLEPVFDVLDCGLEGYIQAGEVAEHLPELHRSYSMVMTYHMNVLKPNDEERERLADIHRYVTSAMDKDKDGSVSRFEYGEYVIDLIEATDDDGDAEVTREELSVDPG